MDEHPYDTAAREAGPAAALLVEPGGRVRVLRDYKRCVQRWYINGSPAARCTNKPVVGHDLCGTHLKP